MKKKLLISFDNRWILSKQENEVLPVPRMLMYLKDKISYELISASHGECEIALEESFPDEDIIAAVHEFLTSVYPEDQKENVVSFSFSQLKNEDVLLSPDELFSEEETEKQKEEPARQDLVEAVMKKIRALVGAEEFKALAEECVKVAPGLIEHGVLEAFTHRCYIFAINNGNGLSTYLELYAELLSALGLFSCNPDYKVAEEKLLPPASGAQPHGSPFDPVYQHFTRGKLKRKGSEKIICVDISEWMTKTTDKSFREFLSQVEDRLGEFIFVFRVPFVEKEIMDNLCKNLGDVFFIRDVSFIPFNQEELLQCAEKAVADRGYTVDPAAWEIFHARVTEEKNDGRFYGINTVNKIIREMIYIKQLKNAENGVNDCLIKREEIASLATLYDGDEKRGIDLLDDFIGMESVKARVEEIVAQIEMSLKSDDLGAPSVHMRFIGNPGTGKTTVARVIGKILREKGILRNGSFFEYSGRDFCGRYVGETAPKTAAICRDAYGSVLFIDEAYSLYRSENIGSADFGREAVDTLIAEMENHRSDLVVIMAGYPDEMNTLMKANSGLESRMPHVIEFPNYTREQLFEIFMKMVRRNFSFREGFEETVREYFLSLSDDLLLAKDFSNARFVRNLYERTWGKAVLRSRIRKEASPVLTKEDFLSASSEKEFKSMMKKKPRTLGFA